MVNEYKHSLCDLAIQLEIFFLACENCQNVSLGIVKSKDL